MVDHTPTDAPIEVKIRAPETNTPETLEDLPFVSVIIPIYNDEARLKECLKALRAQSYPDDRFEVIVVDNASTPRVELDASTAPGLKMVIEHRRGSYAARNLGLRVAQGEIFAFTDSDCRPDADWILNGVCALIKDPAVGLVGGRFQLYYPNGTRSLSERFDHSVAFPQDRYVHVDGYAATGNAFTYRSVVEHVGGFDPALQSGGDTEFGKRVGAHGYQIRYAEDAVVSHPVRDGKEAKKKMRRFAIAMRERHIRGQTSWAKRLMEVGIYLIPSRFQAKQVLQSNQLPGLWHKCAAFLFIMQRRFSLVASYIDQSIALRSIPVSKSPGPLSPIFLRHRPAASTHAARVKKLVPGMPKPAPMQPEQTVRKTVQTRKIEAK